MEMSARQMLNRTFWKVFNVAARLVAIQFFVAALGKMCPIFGTSVLITR
jgi:hypothetical protein